MCEINFEQIMHPDGTFASTVSCKVSGKPLVFADYAGMFCEDMCDYQEKHDMYGFGNPGEIPDECLES